MTTDSSDETENYTLDYGLSYNEWYPNEVPLGQLQDHIQQLSGQDGTMQGRYEYMDKLGRNITVVYVASISALKSGRD